MYPNYSESISTFAMSPLRWRQIILLYFFCALLWHLLNFRFYEYCIFYLVNYLSANRYAHDNDIEWKWSFIIYFRCGNYRVAVACGFHFIRHLICCVRRRRIMLHAIYVDCFVNANKLKYVHFVRASCHDAFCNLNIWSHILFAFYI